MGNKIGVNIPLTGQGFDTAEEVLQLHIDKTYQLKKRIFSTSSRINFKKARELDLILLSNRAGLRYLAEIEEYHHLMLLEFLLILLNIVLQNMQMFLRIIGLNSAQLEKLLQWKLKI